MTRATLAFAADAGSSGPVAAMRGLIAGLCLHSTSEEWAATRPYRLDLGTSGSLAKAAKAWRSEKVIPEALFDLLPDDMKIRAGALAHQWDRAFVSEIYDSLAKASISGQTLKEWTKKAQRIVDKYGAAENAPKLFPGGKFSPWYADLVYRNNMAAISAGGRYAEMFSRRWIEDAPYWLFNAIEDGRNCPSGVCLALDGKVVKKSDMAGRHFLPPCHHRCRCNALEIDADALKAGKYKVSTGRSLRDAGLVIPDGWDVDRVDALVPAVLRGGVSLKPEVVN